MPQQHAFMLSLDNDPNARIIGHIVMAILQDAPDVTLQALLGVTEIEIIIRRGYKDGRAAGSWVIDGNTSPEAIAILIQGIKEGDPAIMDQLPAPRLNGEFADDLTWEGVMRDEGIRYDSEIDIDGRDDLRQEYEAAFNQGVADEIESSLKQHIEP